MKTSFNCPLCAAELLELIGERMHPGDPDYGITLTCPSTSCPAQEVMGHGENSKQAFAVILQKFPCVK